MKEEIKKFKKSIDDILGTESNIIKKIPTINDHKRESFNIILTGLQHINARSIALKHDFKLDFSEYDDVFFSIIESLMSISFLKEQKSVINWWLYDKFLPDGNMLILNDEETGEEIPTATPDDIWELIQKWNEKKNTD